MHTTLTFAAAAIATMAFVSAANAASFNCYGRLTATEAAICATPQLSSLDSRMAQTYFQASGASSPSLRKRLQRDQVAWLRYRNGCGGNVSCLRSAYISRINVMDTWGD